MPYIDSIRVFVRTIELGSISAGGRDQRLSPAVASNRIKELEDRLGIRLFNRTTRKISPTEIGLLFYEYARRVIEAVNDAEGAVADYARHPRGSIRVMAPLSLSRRVIAPLVPLFNEQYPDLAIRLRLSDRKIDLMNEGMDIAFTLGDLEDSSMVTRKIMDCPRTLCASPVYLARYGTPVQPDDLAGGEHQCLLLQFPGVSEYTWTLQTASGPNRIKVSGAYDADEGDVLTEWALDGRGIVNKPYFEVAEHIRRGTLVPVMKNFPPPPSRLSCLYPHRRLQDPKIRLFTDFMIDSCRVKIETMMKAVEGRKLL